MFRLKARGVSLSSYPRSALHFPTSDLHKLGLWLHHGHLALHTLHFLHPCTVNKQPFGDFTVSLCPCYLSPVTIYI